MIKLKIRDNRYIGNVNMIEFWTWQTKIKLTLDDMGYEPVSYDIYEISEEDMVLLKIKHHNIGDFYDYQD